MTPGAETPAVLDPWFSSFQNGLISGIFYDMVENFNKISEYDKHCGSPSNNDKDRTVRNICAKTLNYLKTKYSVTDSESNKYDVCKLLNYWVYNRLNEVYLANKKNFDIKGALEEIERKWKKVILDKNNKDYYQKCKPDIVLFEYTDWKQRKELYDYYADIEHIISIANRFNNCEDYYKYVHSKANLYAHFKKNCVNENSDTCPNFYKECKNYDPRVILPELNCHEALKDKYVLPSTDAINENRPTDGELDSSELKMGSDISYASPRENANPSPIPSFGNALLGIVATSMTSGILYKFTPLGRQVRNSMGWNRNTINNINGEVSGLLPDETYNPYSGGAEEHYIGYHPA